MLIIRMFLLGITGVFGELTQVAPAVIIGGIRA